MSVTPDHVTDISQLMKAYFKAIHDSDAEALGRVFHPDARYVHASEYGYKNHSIETYFSVIKKRDSTETQEQVMPDKIIATEVGDDNLAFVKANMYMMGRKYLDFLTLIKTGPQWLIISKVFTYQPYQENINALCKH